MKKREMLRKKLKNKEREIEKNVAGFFDRLQPKHEEIPREKAEKEHPSPYRMQSTFIL